jgi:hypothetical protein
MWRTSAVHDETRKPYELAIAEMRKRVERAETQAVNRKGLMGAFMHKALHKGGWKHKPEDYKPVVDRQ